MKLVITYEQTDGCTYSFTNHVPVEYESVEALYCHLMDTARSAAADDFDSCGKVYERLGLDLFDFIRFVSNDAVELINDPQIRTLDDWFETYCPNH